MKEKDQSPRKRKPKTTIICYISNNLQSTCTRHMFKTLRYYQSTTHALIPKMPFSRLIREIINLFSFSMRMRKEALLALQISAEQYLTELFVDSNRCASHAKRVTIKPRDIQLVLDVRGPVDPGFA